jgi:AmmeMemoRadiSam system protein B
MPIRPAAVAGVFYERDADRLRAEVDAHLAAGRGGRLPPPVALVAPHAGYAYSGPIAGSAWATVAPLAGRIARVLILGPAHRIWVDGCAVPGCAAFATPLGRVDVDDDAQERLVEELGVEVRPDAHVQEHSLEVQLPFLVRTLGALPIIPVLVGGAPVAAVERIIAACADARTLVVVSTDLSHFLPYAQAQRSDRAACDAVLAGDDGAIADDQACGHQPLKALLRWARTRQLTPRLLDLRNSGDTAGDRSRVVGYAAFAFS